MHPSPNLNGTPNARTRQLSTASVSNANAHPAVGLGLGSSVSSTNSQHDMPNSHTHSSPLSNHTSVSPRLASLECERDHRRTASQNGSSSPTLANIPEGSNSNRLTPRSASPAGSSSSKFSASNGQRPQDQPLPLSASPSVPDSARSLEASTLDSMFRPSESLESFNDEKVAKRSLGRSSPTNAERIAVAEAIARATEEKWKAEQKRASLDQVQTGNSAEAGHLNGARSLGHSTTEGSVVKEMQEDEAIRAAKQAAEEQQEELRREAEEERARLEEEARQRAEATHQAEQKRIEAEAKAERVKQEEEAEAERKRIEAEVEAERLRKEEEAEAERKRQEEEAEAERKRQEEEAEAARKRQEEEAEAERKRQEEEAEAERQRQEAAAAEAERKRIEEEKIAAERARLEAIEAAAREKEAAEARARDGVRERLQSASGDVALTGFVSVQGGSSIVGPCRIHPDPLADGQCYSCLAVETQIFPALEHVTEALQKRQRCLVTSRRGRPC